MILRYIKIIVLILLALLILSPLYPMGRQAPVHEKLIIEEKKDPSWEFQKDSIVTITGIIAQLREIQQDREAVVTYFALVRSGAVVYAVHLGPKWYIESKGFKFGEDQTITVTGSRVTEDSHPAIIATEVELDGRILPLRDVNNGVPFWFEPDQPSEDYKYCIHS